MATTLDDRMTVRAQAKWLRMSARKARLVLDHIRGRSVPEARTRVTWQVRFLIRFTRPRARGFQRLSVGPSSAYAASTTRSSPSRP